MALNYSPTIVKDGLTMCLDPGSITSYPGTGTTVFDLSGNNKNGVLTNGTVYSNLNNGVFSFDGTNDTINLGIGNTFFPLYQFSLEAWVKSPGLGTGMAIGGIWGFTYGLRIYIDGSGNIVAGINNSAGTSQTYPSVSGNYFDNIWHHIILSHNGTTAFIYVDGVLKNSTACIWTGTTYWPTNSVNIGRDNNNSNYYLYGYIGSPKIYNKALTLKEVQQNYNAQISRFNL